MNITLRATSYVFEKTRITITRKQRQLRKQKNPAIPYNVKPRKRFTIKCISIVNDYKFLFCYAARADVRDITSTKMEEKLNSKRRTAIWKLKLGQSEKEANKGAWTKNDCPSVLFYYAFLPMEKKCSSARSWKMSVPVGSSRTHNFQLRDLGYRVSRCFSTVCTWEYDDERGH